MLHPIRHAALGSRHGSRAVRRPAPVPPRHCRLRRVAPRHRPDSLGWTAEFRIPFSQLRFSGAPQQVWGVRFVRTILRKNEFSFWPFVWKTESGLVSRFAHLLGLRDIPAPRRVELLPYLVSRGTSPGASAWGNPFDRRAGYFGGAGVDLKYGMYTYPQVEGTDNPEFR